MTRIVKSIFILSCFVIISGIVWAFSEGSNFSGSTGAPGEASCSCHGTPDLGSGSVSIVAQGGFTPGETIDITANVKNNNMSRWGFAVTVLNGNDQPVGELVVSDTVRTLKTISNNNRQYIKQTDSGSDFGTIDSTMWQFQWIAPDAGVDEVTFYMSGLAADGNFMPNGDSSYTATLLITRTGADNDYRASLPSDFFLTQNHPNPFNPSTTIEYSLPIRSHVTITIHNLLSQRIKTIVDESKSAGRHTVLWNGRDYYGNQVTSGVYFYKIQAGDFARSKKMLLLK